MDKLSKMMDRLSKIAKIAQPPGSIAFSSENIIDKIQNPLTMVVLSCDLSCVELPAGAEEDEDGVMYKARSHR